MKFIGIIFCDDIRQERNNKFSLMGVFNDRIILNTDNKQPEIKWPQPMNLAALLRFAIGKDDEQPDRFELEYILNKKSILKVANELNINLIGKSEFQLVINGIGFPIEPGTLGISIKFYIKDKLIFSEDQDNVLKIVNESTN
jgi:hypothetical protein